MKEWKKRKWILAYVFVAVTGTLFHFMYGWLQEARLAGYFFPVNESTWEHMKLVYVPMILCGMIFMEKTNVQWMLGIMVGTWLIPVCFYSYRGILGFGIPVCDIGTFFLSVAGAFWFVHHILQAEWTKERVGRNGIKFLVVLQGILFVLFTYHPPGLGIFLEP